MTMTSSRRPRTRTLRTGVISAVLLSLAGVGAASASSTGGSAVEVIHAVRTTEDQTALDLGAAGNSLGDQQVFTARFDANGKTIGFDGGTCTLVRLPQVYQCVATNSLPRGQVTAQALVDFQKAPGPYQFAITGGTDRYRTAAGTVTVLFGQDNDQVTFRIVTRPRG
jgi:hypothetical protein